MSLFKILSYTVGYLIIVAIPVTFFIFGWKEVELSCYRELAGKNPSCEIVETFGISVYSRTKLAKDIRGIGYQSDAGTHHDKAGSIKTLNSTLIFDTEAGQQQITHSVSSSSEKQLILMTREFLNNPQALRFRQKFSLRSAFGWIGLIGTSLIFLVFLEVVRYNLFKSRRR